MTLQCCCSVGHSHQCLVHILGHLQVKGENYVYRMDAKTIGGNVRYVSLMWQAVDWVACRLF